MANQPAVWGVHMGRHVESRPVEENYVAIGWRGLGDIRTYADRDAFKEALTRRSSDEKRGAIPVHAGILYRFVHEMKAGDLVVYPQRLVHLIDAFVRSVLRD